MIETKSRIDDQTHHKCFAQNVDKGVKRSTINRVSYGTTVTILDFMYNLPVRRMNVDEIFDLECIREFVGAVAIIHPHISFTLRNDSNGGIVMRTTKSNDPLLTFKSLYGDSKAASMKKVCFENEKLKISGFVGTEGHSNKKLQFVYVNRHYLPQSKIHKLIDSLCCQTSIGRKFGRFASPNEMLDANGVQVRQFL